MPAPTRRHRGDSDFVPPSRVAIGRIAVVMLSLGIVAGSAAK